MSSTCRVGSLVVEARPQFGYLRLRHPSRASERSEEQMDYTVGLAWTTPSFGDRRWWFCCPVSGRRCAVLYLPRGAHKFACARAYRLAYAVTRMPEHDRLLAAWHDADEHCDEIFDAKIAGCLARLKRLGR